MASDQLQVISAALGWTYFFAWSFSFYPQIIINYRNRRSRLPGLSLHFLAYNFTGFAFYLLFVWGTYSYSCPRSVDLNDIAFALHAFLITSITIIQCLCYGRLQVGDSFTYPNRVHASILTMLWITPAILAVLATFGILPWHPEHNSGSGFSVLAYFGAAKVFITAVKYIPQAVLNWRRKSTVDWSIGNVLLDLSGGILSLLQQCVDAYAEGTVEIFETNAPKLLLACLSIFFDILFICQHFVWYKLPQANDLRSSLLEG